MIIKPRLEPLELLILRSLNNRMELLDKEKNYYINVEKGFVGEKKFDEWMEEILNEEWLVLNDLLLESKNSVFQIDSLLITAEKIYLFEIKNYEGDYYIEADRWYTLAGKEILNPISQLNRCESLFRSLLHDLGNSYVIESYVVFINNHFSLYEAPRNLPFVFPTQLHKLRKKLITNKGTLNKKHSKLAKQLLSLHFKESPYSRLPPYDYNALKKGVTCFSCQSFLELSKTKEATVQCHKCGKKEGIHTTILRSAKEFNMLFPERKMTTNEIYEWCKGIRSKRLIRKILMEKYKLNGLGKGAYFIKHEEK